MEVVIIFPIVTNFQVKYLLEQEKCRKCKAGLGFVHQELNGWLWFAIAVISCD